MMLQVLPSNEEGQLKLSNSAAVDSGIMVDSKKKDYELK